MNINTTAFVGCAAGGGEESIQVSNFSLFEAECSDEVPVTSFNELASGETSDGTSTVQFAIPLAWQPGQLVPVDFPNGNTELVSVAPGVKPGEAVQVRIKHDFNDPSSPAHPIPPANDPDGIPVATALSSPNLAQFLSTPRSAQKMPKSPTGKKKMLLKKHNKRPDPIAPTAHGEKGIQVTAPHLLSPGGACLVLLHIDHKLLLAPSLACLLACRLLASPSYIGT